MNASVACPHNSIVEPTTADALALAIAKQRTHVLKLEQIVADSRDAVVRAGAELDGSVRARDRALFRLLHLTEQLDESDIDTAR